MPALPTERAEVIVRLGARKRPRAGESLRLGVDPSDVHLFDAGTGVAL
jgi:hypothetical protein